MNTSVAASVVAIGGLVGSSVLGSAAAAKSTGSAHIVARPSSIMVNDTTKLVGSGFGVSQEVEIEECGSAVWLVVANPCDTDSSTTVKTNAQGHFKVVFTVHTCSTANTPGFSQTCYIGEPKPSGVDTIALEGVVTITVTGP